MFCTEPSGTTQSAGIAGFVSYFGRAARRQPAGSENHRRANADPPSDTC